MKQPEPFGKFLLLGQVAVGGMAEIYKARYADPALQSIELAIKRILPSYTEDEGFVTMFKDEGNIALRLNHPNIVKIYEVGEVNGDWYIAMEYIHGSDLRILSDAAEKYNRRFTPTQVARIMCETAKALHYAHTCTAADGTPLNIVHRDCTPHNIMISQNNCVKLMDFGIAKAASRATKTRIGTVKGKSSYMSPEQAKGKALDGRSDMFTLGTVIWELLTGYRLFKANSDFDILTKVLKSEIIHPSRFGADVPVELGDIVMRTLERNRDLRYQDCGELARVLETWIVANGDGSDTQLGNMALALTNRQGHSYMEAPEFVRGPAEYTCVDNEFVPTGNAPSNQFGGGGSELGGPTEAVAAPSPFQINAAMQQQPMQPAMQPAPPMFPSDPMLPATTTNKVPVLYIAAYAFMALLIIACFVIAGYVSSSNDAEATEFAPPTSLISIKVCANEDCTSNADDFAASVKIDDTPVLDENGKPQLTPVIGYKAPLGKNIKITFEKEGYETVTIERPVVLTNHSFNAYMPPAGGGVPEFTIRTSPDGLSVKVDGEDKGKSPVKLENVKYGANLVVEVEDDSGASEKKTIKVTKEVGTSVEIVLAKADNDADSQAADKKPGDKGTVVAKDDTKSNDKTKTATNKTNTNKNTQQKATTGGGKGKISCKARPWATASIDGSRLGPTPKDKEVKEGKHKVELVHPSLGKQTKTVTVKNGQTVTVGYDFVGKKWM